MIDVLNDQLYEQEISLQQPFRNFASIKEGIHWMSQFYAIFQRTLLTSHRDVVAALRESESESELFTGDTPNWQSLTRGCDWRKISP